MGRSPSEGHRRCKCYGCNMHGHLPQPRAFFIRIRQPAGERFICLNLHNHAALLFFTIEPPHPFCLFALPRHTLHSRLHALSSINVLYTFWCASTWLYQHLLSALSRSSCLAPRTLMSLNFSMPTRDTYECTTSLMANMP